MDIVLSPLEKKLIHIPTILNRYTYNKDFDADRDRVSDMHKRSKNGECVIHELKIGEHYVGFVALSFDKLGDSWTCLFIKYLFISSDYRKSSYPELNDMTLGQYLLSLVFELASQTSVRTAPLKYVALIPANDKLQGYYSKEGYISLHGDEEAMFLKI